VAALAALLAGVLGLPGRASAENPALGADLFELCAQCHGADGGGRIAYRAPAIAGLPLWYVKRQLENFQSGARGRHFDDLEGLRMRPMALSLRREGHLDEVAAYVASLPPVKQTPTLTGGDAAAGATSYLLCASCHGVDGMGSEPQNAPPLVIQSDWYLMSSMQKYQKRVRGADTRDTFGLMMQPMAMTLPDEQAMKNVIAHIMSLAK
jgi:cytochrome c oxidase subunit 2